GRWIGRDRRVARSSSEPRCRQRYGCLWGGRRRGGSQAAARSDRHQRRVQPTREGRGCHRRPGSGGKSSLSVNCDTGELADMLEIGVVDPTKVKVYALKAAAEIAEAVLRINTIIKCRNGELQKASE